MTVTALRVGAFLDRVLAGRDHVLASEIEVGNVDDFVVFQRLREADLMFDGILSKRFRIERAATAAENEWLEFRDFAIHRVATEDAT